MSISVVNVFAPTSAAGSTSSRTYTGLTAPSSGNYLYVCFFGNNGSTGVSSLSMTGVSSWTLIASYYETTNGSASVEVWAGLVGASAGTSLTVNTTASQFFTVAALEVSGTTGAADVSSNSTGSSATSCSSGTTSSTTVANELWLGLVMQSSVSSGGTSYSSPTNGYTLQGQPSYMSGVSNYAVMAVMTYIASSTGAAGCSVTSSQSVNYAGLSVAIAGSGSSGPSLAGLLCLMGCGE